MSAEPLSPANPNASTIDVTQVLGLLDGPFSAFAKGFYRKRYAMWLGSGISRDRVPGLPELVLRVVEHLRTKADFSNQDCPYAKAFWASLKLAALGPLEESGVDVSAPVESWTIAHEVSGRLTYAYSDLLNIRVAGEAPDYLIWNALDVIGVYAPVDPEPDCEHLCIAVLVLDAAVQSIVSANWDGLVETAVDELAGPASGQTLSVCVLARDLQAEQTRATLYKVHGCAVLARENEAEYRPLLIGRARQIAGWTSGLSADAAKARLVDLARTSRTFMVGLSAQDSNIQFIFGQDAAKGVWTWPCDPPSHVFAEQEIGDSQRLVLQLAYGDGYDINSEEIEAAALLQAYAKPVLVALVLDLFASKLVACLEARGWNDGRCDDLVAGIISLRDLAATVADGDRLEFVRSLVAHVSRGVSFFRDGRPPAAGTVAYRPLYANPIAQLEHDPDLVASGLLGLAVALGAIGAGVAGSHWTIQLGELGRVDDGVLRLSGSSDVRLYFAANHGAAAEIVSTAIDPRDADNVVVINSQSPVQRQTRSPSSTVGRSGSTGVHEVGIADLLVECESVDHLVQRLREEVGV